MLGLHERPIDSEARESVSAYCQHQTQKLKIRHERNLRVTFCSSCFTCGPLKGTCFFRGFCEFTMKGCGDRLFAGLGFLLGELHGSGHSSSCARIVIYNLPSARRAHIISDISYEINAHVIGLTGTRLPFYRAWDVYTHKPTISQHGWYFEIRWDCQARLSNMSAGVSMNVKKQMWKKKNIWPTLELARKSWRHPISKLARRRHSNCDVLAFEDAKPGQSSSPRGHIVQSRGVNQKDASGDTEPQHTVHYDWPQHLNGHCRRHWRKSTRLSLTTSLHRKRKSRPRCSETLWGRRAWLWSTFPNEANLTSQESEGLWPRSPTLLRLQKCVPRLDQCRVLIRTGIRLQVEKGHAQGWSLLGDSSRSSMHPRRERAREEPTWSADATNAYWTAGWKRLEVTDAVE